MPAFVPKFFWIPVIALAIVGGATAAAWQIFAPAESLTNNDQSTNTPTDESAMSENAQIAAGATADGVDDFGACDQELKTYCSGLYGGDWQTYAEANGYTTASWKYAILDCLEAHDDETSQACKDSRARRDVLNANLTSDCREDIIAYCHDVKPEPGKEPMVDCLGEHYDDLAAECAAAYDAHEAAKPTN